MAVKNPDFRVKHGLKVGGNSTLTGGLSCLDNATFDKNITVNGDLIVEGDTTTLNTTAIEVEDPLLSLGSNNTTNTLDIGFYGQYSTDGGSTKKYAGIFRDADDGIFKLFADQTTDPTTGNINTTGTIAKGTLSADLQGNASTATKWASSLALSFATSAPLAGTVTFDGSTSTVTWGASFRAGAVDTASIADDAITNAKLADDAVDTAEIADSAVENAQIAAGAVDTNELAGSSVTNAKIATDAVQSGNIQANAVITDKIADNQITNAKMADDSVGNDQIIDGSIGSPKLSADAVFTSAIQDAAITTAKIAADNITNALIADDQIDSEHLVAGSVDNEHMAANSVDSDQYVDGSIDAEHYSDDSIALAKMKANSVDSDQYVDGSIDTAHISTDAVTNAKIANDFISINGVVVDLGTDITVEGLSSVIDTGSIDLHIEGDAGNAVLSADVRIADNTLETTTDGVTGMRIKALGVEASHLAVNSVQTAKIVDGAVTNAKLAADSVSDSKIALDHGAFVTLSGSCLSSTNHEFDTTVANDYRTVSYFIQGNVGTDYQTSYVTLLHNGSDVWIMEHGMVHTTDDTFMSYDAVLSGGNVGLIASHTHSNGDATAAVKALKQAIKTGDSNP